MFFQRTPIYFISLKICSTKFLCLQSVYKFKQKQKPRPHAVRVNDGGGEPWLGASTNRQLIAQLRHSLKSYEKSIWSSSSKRAGRLA